MLKSDSASSQEPGLVTLATDEVHDLVLPLTRRIRVAQDHAELRLLPRRFKRLRTLRLLHWSRLSKRLRIRTKTGS